MKTSRPHCSAFTLVELISIIATTAIICLTIVPALARPRATAATLCLNNLRQIISATSLYHAEFNFLPPNPDDGNTVPGHNWVAGHASFLNPETNLALLKNPTYSPLAPYIETSANVFKCPSDPGMVRVQGRSYPTARSISMNHAAGTICPGFNNGAGHVGAPTLSVHGPWLDNAHNHRRDTTWRTFGSLSQVPNPANTWIFIEEDHRSINDGNFAFGAARAEWIDYPATHHEFGCNLAFADGHVEVRRWRLLSTAVTGSFVTRRPVPGSIDWEWLLARTTERLR